VTNTEHHFKKKEEIKYGWVKNRKSEKREEKKEKKRKKKQVQSPDISLASVCASD